MIQPYALWQGTLALPAKSSLQWQLACAPSSNGRAELLISRKWKGWLSSTRMLYVLLLQHSPATRSFWLFQPSPLQSSLALVLSFPELSAWAKFVGKHPSRLTHHSDATHTALSPGEELCARAQPEPFNVAGINKRDREMVNFLHLFFVWQQ